MLYQAIYPEIGKAFVISHQPNKITSEPISIILLRFSFGLYARALHSVACGIVDHFLYGYPKRLT